MFTVIGIVLLIVAILLIGVVLLQPGKGDVSATFGGLSSQFGSMFGMKKTTDLLTKLTIILAASILVLTLLVNRFFISPGEIQHAKPVTEGAALPSQATPPSQQAPGGGQ
jgi:preprotein translocase subunit SecG